MTKSLNGYTLEEFRAMECNVTDTMEFYSVVIVPMPEVHESGYGCMKFILIDRDDNIIGVCGGYSDVIHLNGIGGYGLDFEPAILSQMTPRVAWSLDCLVGSGCLRLFAYGKLCIDDKWVGSDFCVYAKSK